MQRTDIHELNRFIESLFRDIGPIVYTSELPTDLSLFEKFNERAGTICSIVSKSCTEKTEIHFRYASFGSLNAVAASGIVDVVAICPTAPVTILHTFARLLASPSIFPKVGNARAEIERDNLPDIGAELFVVPERLPNCITRQFFAQLLSRTAFDWIIGHEVGHIARGHHALHNSAGGLQIIRERGTSANAGSLTSQVTELDADTFGLTHALAGADYSRAYITTGNRFGDKRLHKAARCAFGTPELTFTHTLFSVWILLRIFAEDLETPFELRTHPPIPIRRTNILESAWRIAILPPLNLTRERALKLAREAVISADYALFHVSQKNMVTPELDSTLIAHAKRLEAHANELVPELLTAQRGEFGDHFGIVPFRVLFPEA